MKRILINFFILPLCLATFGQGSLISEQQARIVAENFFYDRAQSVIPVPAPISFSTGSFSIKDGQEVLYYVFNMSPGGFIAVSAYSATPPVLCYAFSGTYSDTGQPENFSAWMEQYERQISYSIATKAIPSDDTEAQWNYYLDTPRGAIKPFSDREVLPLTTSTWDQGMYYNYQCPADQSGPGGHCVTGCVATALGQLMNYFRWPDTGMGSYSYDCPPYGTLSADFGYSSYEWDLMEPSLNHGNSEVAEVIFHLGVSVDMVYGPDGSGMYNHKGAYTLKTYFKYSPETQYLFRDSTSMDWDSIIVAHLDRKVPMYYAGWSVPDTMGHAFICDGYQGEDYFHFNWGWGGSYDGYFYTDDLTPGGNLFNLAQELIINAVPDTSLYTYPLFCEGDKMYSALAGTIGDGSGPLYSYENGSTCSWLIAPDDSVVSITLDFLSFDTDPNDMVTVYAGDTTMIGTFSGNSLPDAITTDSNSMLVVFERDSEITGDGFLAHFLTETPVYCSGIANFYNQADTVSDGSAGWNYYNNAACLFRILPEGASSVTLYFTEFETEEGVDMLKIFDLETQELLADYSGSYSPGVPDPVTSPSGKIFLVFSSNYDVNAPGWVAYYESDLVSIEETGNDNSVIFFPNPATDRITVRFINTKPGMVTLTLYDLSGRQLSAMKANAEENGQISMGLEHIPAGIYFLSVIKDSGNAGFHKIIIK